MAESLNALPKENKRKTAEGEPSLSITPEKTIPVLENNQPLSERPIKQQTITEEPLAESENFTQDVNQGINRLGQITDESIEDEEEPALEVKPMNYFVFLLLLLGASLVDGIDIVNSFLNLSGVWMIVATFFNILAQGAFAVLTWILCDKYLRQAIKAVKSKKGEMQQQFMQIIDLMRKISRWLKPLQVILGVIDSIPWIELIPMTMISVGLVYWYSKKIPRELLAANASEMIRLGGKNIRQKMEQGAEIYERGSQAIEGIKRSASQTPRLNRVPA
jgi:hypothetical protein